MIEVAGAFALAAVSALLGLLWKMNNRLVALEIRVADTWELQSQTHDFLVDVLSASLPNGKEVAHAYELQYGPVARARRSRGLPLHSEAVVVTR